MTHFLFSLCLLFLGLAYLFQTHVEALAFFVASMVFAAAAFISLAIHNLNKRLTAQNYTPGEVEFLSDAGALFNGKKVGRDLQMSVCNIVDYSSRMGIDIEAAHTHMVKHGEIKDSRKLRSLIKQISERVNQ